MLKIKRFIVTAILTGAMMTSVLAAPPKSLTESQVASYARVALVMSSVEGNSYDLYVASDDDHLMTQKYMWKSHDDEENWVGHYYLYLKPVNSKEKAVRQNVRLYNENFPRHKNQTMILDRNYPNYNGFYLAKGKAGLPDILIRTERVTGGGGFATQAYVIKDGKLNQLKYLDENKNVFYTRIAGSKPFYYLDDGTFAVPWWTNIKPGGSFITVYMLDSNNLTLIPAYTVKE